MLLTRPQGVSSSEGSAEFPVVVSWIPFAAHSECFPFLSTLPHSPQPQAQGFGYHTGTHAVWVSQKLDAS